MQAPRRSPLCLLHAAEALPAATPQPLGTHLGVGQEGGLAAHHLQDALHPPLHLQPVEGASAARKGDLAAAAVGARRAAGARVAAGVALDAVRAPALVPARRAARALCQLEQLRVGLALRVAGGRAA